MKYIKMDDWHDSFTDIAERDDEVSQEIYDYFLNIMPPIGLKGGQGYVAGFQVGEADCHKTDINGNWKPQFMTFVKQDDRCFYKGINFAGYVDSREMEQNYEATEDDSEDMEL